MSRVAQRMVEGFDTSGAVLQVQEGKYSAHQLLEGGRLDENIQAAQVSALHVDHTLATVRQS